MWQKEFAKALDTDFKKLKAKNPKFSLRAYARKVGLSPSALSQLLRGHTRWSLTPARAAEVLTKLPLKPAVRNRLMVKIGGVPQFSEKSLAEIDYAILADWAVFPVLFSFDLPKKLATVEKISARLGLPPARVLSIVEDLLQRGLLVRGEDGQITRPDVMIRTSDGVPKETIRKSHEMNLDVSRKALAALPTARRDFTSLTFAGSESQIELIRSEIRKLYDRVSSEMNVAETNDNVFRLSVQLFPLDFQP